ncbi:MAG: NAD(P)H-dependent glycerol-3-phosphate dehydrogenase [Terriglobales bacterium]
MTRAASSFSGPWTVIGAGGWGTALAIVLARQGLEVRLWARRPETAAVLAASRENSVYLPGVRLPANVAPGSDLPGALRGAAAVLLAAPSAHTRPLLDAMAAYLTPATPLISATKGLEEPSLMRMSEVANDVLRPHFARPLRHAVLSGPTFAREVARGEPAAVVIASADAALAAVVQAAFSSPVLRLYTSNDVAGVELGAAVKNVIAIAAGLCDGLGLGANTRAALIARGLAEMARLAEACGGRRETLSGLAGLGDLVLTCTGDLSRNRTVGLELGRGQRLADILSSRPTVAEGVTTCAATVRLAARHGVEMPITEQIHAVLFQQRAPREAVRVLMERSLKAE